MNIVNEEYGDKLKKLNIRDIRTDEKSMEYLKTIIKMLSKGIKFYFVFVSEGDVKIELEQSPFSSVGYLTINESTYSKILSLWKNFKTMVLFSPNSTFSWQNIDKEVISKNPELIAIDIIEKKHTNSVFVKGHDGDNLIFMYGVNYQEALVKDVIDFMNKS